jgi:hypothetical protein
MLQRQQRSFSADLCENLCVLCIKTGVSRAGLRYASLPIKSFLRLNAAPARAPI